MIIICPNQEDSHASFPHYLITSSGNSGNRDLPVTLVVCAHCDHWIARPVPSCRCREDCHEEAREKTKPKYLQKPTQTS